LQEGRSKVIGIKGLTSAMVLVKESGEVMVVEGIDRGGGFIDGGSHNLFLKVTRRGRRRRLW
jgi:hypothetical protein